MNGLSEAEQGSRTGAEWAVERAERSFDAFYAAAAGRLAVQLYLVTGDLEEARDCAQEAFARAWQRWDVLHDRDDDRFGWVYTVGYRIAVSRFRRRIGFTRALSRTVPLPPVAGPAPEVIVVREALATLPHGQRAALVLHYFEGLPVEAVARTLGIGVSAAKSRLARGRAALAPLLAEEGPR